MRKLILILIFLSAKVAFASNLVFNQPFLINAGDSTTYTVPVGETWEVVGVTANLGFGQPADAYATINGAPAVLLAVLSVLGNPSGYGVINFSPLWLPAGTTIKGGGGFISILEYNITP